AVRPRLSSGTNLAFVVDPDGQPPRNSQADLMAMFFGIGAGKRFSLFGCRDRLWNRHRPVNGWHVLLDELHRHRLAHPRLPFTQVLLAVLFDKLLDRGEVDVERFGEAGEKLLGDDAFALEAHYLVRSLRDVPVSDHAGELAEAEALLDSLISEVAAKAVYHGCSLVVVIFHHEVSRTELCWLFQGQTLEVSAEFAQRFVVFFAQMVARILMPELVNE